MSSNGLLSFYDAEKKVFKTIHMHHIEHNYCPDVDSFQVLKAHYSSTDRAKLFFTRMFHVSHFEKDFIKYSDSLCEIVESKTIEDLISYTRETWPYASNYVFYDNCWYSNPVDIKNIYFERDEPEIEFNPEFWDYHTSINVCEYFISKKLSPEDASKNSNVSKLAILKPAGKPPVVIAIQRTDIQTRLVTNQIRDIRNRLLEIYDNMENSSIYEFEPGSNESNYRLQRVFFQGDEANWSNFLALEDLASEHALELDTLESLVAKV